MTIEKNKNLFIITLENDKKTYFNFSDGCIYGMTGKKVKDFCPEAKRILKAYADNDFLARYFAVRNKDYDYYFINQDGEQKLNGSPAHKKYMEETERRTK